MRQRKKGAFLTFIFSLLPGAAEMYMGFMKNGISLMALFFLFIIPTTASRYLEFFGFIAVIIWFYGFFHARNIATLDDESFMKFEDKCIWQEFSEFDALNFSNSTLRKWFAAFLILLGCGILWGYLADAIYRLIPEEDWNTIYPIIEGIPQFVLAVILIILGILLIRGKKKEIKTEVQNGDNNQNA